MIAPAIAPKVNPLSISSFTLFDSSLYFPANYNSNGVELWKVKDTTTLPNTRVGVVNNTVSLAVYPNPNNGICNISISGKNVDRAELSVYDVTGKKLHQQTVRAATASINLSHLPKGTYEMKLQDGEKITTAKLVIQ